MDREQTTSSFLLLYVAAVGALAAFGFAATIYWDPSLSTATQPTVQGVLALIAIGLALDLTHPPLAKGADSGSIVFVVYLSAAMVFGPAWSAGLSAVTVAGSQLLIRKPPIRILFNVSQTMISVIAGTTVYMLLGGKVPPTDFQASMVPFAGLVVTYFLVNSTAVSGAIALNGQGVFREIWQRSTLQLVGYDLIASFVALGAAWLYTRIDVLAIVLVTVPIVFIRHAYAINYTLETTNRELLDLMVKAIEARDPYTSGHSQRVAELAGALARDLRLGLKEIERISTAALLHDVGKIYEEFAPILRKEGRLTAEEKAVMQTHPVRSAELVGTITSLHGYVYKCVRHHHENYDGSGYPDGLVARQIPIGARIIMVADTMDAMTTDRPYRRALPFERVVEELTKYAGKQFDPFVLEAFHRSSNVRRLIDQRVSRPAEPQAPRPGKVAQLALR